MLIEKSRKYESSIFNTTLPSKEVYSCLRNGLLTSVIALGLTLGISGQVWAAPIGVSFTKIAETEILANPDSCTSTNCFYSFQTPAISNDEVAFIAFQYPTGVSGIFTSLDGSISNIKRGVCFTPGSCTRIGGDVSLSDETVAFFLNTSSYGYYRSSSLLVGSNGVLNTAFSYSCSPPAPIGNPAYCTQPQLVILPLVRDLSRLTLTRVLLRVRASIFITIT